MSSLLENAPYAFSVKGRSGRYLLFNPGKLKALNRTQEEYMTKPPADLSNNTTTRRPRK
ncbi:MAG: hypothetical protein P8N43_01770 [Alphaproteobacteria bacterium]|nr:hypothetical protein [Alphaproteobacteria bacterium]